MKRTLIITLCFISSAAMAQTGFFLQPVAGIGLTNVRHVDFTSQSHSDDYDLNFDAGVLAGYCHGKWVFTTGLQYLRTGSKVPQQSPTPLAARPALHTFITATRTWYCRLRWAEYSQ